MVKSSFPLLIVSLLIPISSSNVFIIWVGLEINTIVFIFILKTSKMSESMVKYFLAQEIGTMLMILAITSHIVWYSEISLIHCSSLVTMSMLVKVGASPFHHWAVQVGVSMNNICLAMFLTLQKVPPLFILSVSSHHFLLFLSMLLSGMVGSGGMLMLNKIKPMIVLSSLSHLSWMIISSLMSKKTLMFYMSIYSLILVNLISEVKKNKMISIPSSPIKALPLIMMMLSLGGLPPLAGFAPKLAVIMTAALSSTMVCCILMLLFFSVVSLISYTRAMYKMTLKSVKLEKITNKTKDSNFLMYHLMLMPTIFASAQFL